jgi:hypothetical protein
MASPLQVVQQLRSLAEEADRLRVTALRDGVLSEKDSAAWVAGMCQLTRINRRAIERGWCDLAFQALAAIEVLGEVPSGAVAMDPMAGLLILKAKKAAIH